MIAFFFDSLVERETRLELATVCLEGRSSSQLSYSRIALKSLNFKSSNYNLNIIKKYLIIKISLIISVIL